MISRDLRRLFKSDIRTLLGREDIACVLNNEGDPKRIIAYRFLRHLEFLTRFPSANFGRARTGLTAIAHDQLDRCVGQKLYVTGMSSASDYRSLQDIRQLETLWSRGRFEIKHRWFIRFRRLIRLLCGFRILKVNILFKTFGTLHK